MNNRVALITGANKGIGLEIARQLGMQGIIVLLGARSQAKAEQAAASLREQGLQAEPVELDVSNQRHIEAAAKWIQASYGRLDILVNNAGVYMDDIESDVEAMRRTFEVNVFGPYALTEALLPLLTVSPAGRIVNQSSILGSMTTILSNDLAGYMARPYYSSSKAALNMLTAQLSVRLRETPVKVNACHPGWVQTDMGGKDAPMSIAEGAETAVRLALLPDAGPTGGYYHKNDVLPW